MRVDEGIQAVTQQQLDKRGAFRLEREPYFPDASERSVEVPYVASRADGEQRILDIGTSLSDLTYFWLLSELAKRNDTVVTTLDIIPFERVKNRVRDLFTDADLKRFDFNVGDIRRCQFKDDTFELALCISVLEHIGFDERLDDRTQDTVFNRPLERPRVDQSPDAYYARRADVEALSEMERVLKPSGRLILTIPYGKGEFLVIKDSKDRYSTEMQYNRRKWEDVKSKIGLRVEEERYFSKYDAGWFEHGRDERIDYGRQTGGVLCTTLTKPA